ncbi:MAG: hypothetical protein F6K58_02280 [Symploca sp. SIO2E9]|nr:hypothetical protein [Symploca sp. SIO2E9]
MSILRDKTQRLNQFWVSLRFNPTYLKGYLLYSRRPLVYIEGQNPAPQSILGFTKVQPNLLEGVSALFPASPSAILESKENSRLAYRASAKSDRSIHNQW